jgi:hypothetical protein
MIRRISFLSPAGRQRRSSLVLCHAEAGLVDVPVAGTAEAEDLPFEIRPVPGQGLIPPDGVDLEGFEGGFPVAELTPVPKDQVDLPDLDRVGRELTGRGMGSLLILPSRPPPIHLPRDVPDGDGTPRQGDQPRGGFYFTCCFTLP